MRALCQLPSKGSKYVANYLDPGSGYVFTSSLSAIIGVLLGFLFPIFFFFRKFFLNKKILIGSLLIFIAVIIFFVSNMANNSSTNKKVVIIGFDGMDPNILEQGWKKGLFPNLKKLKDQGYFSKLETVVPPQSPVAWASFITGASPSKHGIYDFIMRNPKDYSLRLVFSEGEGTDIQSRKIEWRAIPFWETASKNKIPTTILFLPDTFEPPNIEASRVLSGMGVPDVLGTEGTFTLFSTKNYNTDDYKFRGKVVRIESKSSIKAEIEGPKYVFLNETKTTTTPLNIEINKNRRIVTIKIQNQKIDILEKEFSDWVRLEFKIDFWTKISGIGRFYLKSLDPFELYLSPINFNPENPIRPISYPKVLAKELAQKNGLYSTLGLPHDTWALEENVFDEDSFLKQAESILAERKKIYFSELKRFKKGLFFGYFGSTDTISHMFWRFLGTGSKYKDTIFDYYSKMDEIVGDTQKHIDKDTTLIILSDHGFWAFDYEVNLNSWLRDNGYLVLKDSKKEGGPLFEDVDWSKTRVFAAGYNSLYFNVRGRESRGIVEQKDIPGFESKIIDKLMEFKNPATGQKIMRKVYTREDMGISNSDNNAPDMILGFYKGTRASWDSAVGTITDYVIRKRESKWSGDHLFDPTEVPGILFSNKKLNVKNPRIEDVMPLVLNSFGTKH